MRNSPKIKDISQHLGQLPQHANVSKIAVPHTEIEGRAPIYDLSKIPNAYMGVERIFFNSLKEISNESHSNGGPVFKANKFDDPLDRVRFTGPGWNTNYGHASGDHISNSGIGDTIEITFYGTGLNILGRTSAISSRDIRYTVNGGAESGNLWSTNGWAGSTIIQNREYQANNVQPVVSGLTAGLHTVKLETYGAGNLFVYGFEILNESTELSVPAGSVLKDGEVFNNPTLQTAAYGSDFTNEYNTGSTTKGGAVTAYLDRQGIIRKDIRWTDATQGNLGSADHSNEEIVQKFHWRQFGAGRGDDFTQIGTANNVNAAFTLDDGTTTLVGSNVDWDDVSGLRHGSGAGDFYTLTFVGTGLDIRGIVTAAGFVDVIIDGTNIGDVYDGGGSDIRNIPVVSGLPFGTHTVKFERVGGGNLNVTDFIVYAPKKPELPEGAAKIGSYYKMADYAADTVGTTPSISTGTLRKSPVREGVYTGTWNAIAEAQTISAMGQDLSADATADFSYTGFGTGFEWLFYGASNRDTASVVEVDLHDGNGYTAISETNFTITYFLNGVQQSSAGAGPAIDVYMVGEADIAFNTTAGTVDTNSAASVQGQVFSVQGLPLGAKTFRATRGNGRFSSQGLAWTTPVYSYNSSRDLLHDRLVGSNSIRAEAGTPHFEQEKKHFPQGVDLGASKTKWQKLWLDTNITGLTSTTMLHNTTGNEAFRFNNLEIGKTYRLSVTVKHELTSTDSGNGINVYNGDGGALYLMSLGLSHSSSTGNDRAPCTGVVVFTAVDNSIVVEYSSAASGNTIFAGEVHTWMVLEELDNHIETNQWGTQS